MPLKETDLKTVEQYKKAIRAEAAGKVTAGAATRFWIYRDVELPDASGKKQKITSFIALVDDKAIRPLLKGRKMICKGTCGLTDGKVAFEAEEGKVPYRLLKTNCPSLLGKMVHIPANVNLEEEGEEAEAQQTDAAKVPPATGEQAAKLTAPPLANDVAAEWAKLAPRLQQAVTANPARKEELVKVAGPIPGLIAAKKLDDARARIKQANDLLSIPTPPPPPGPKPPDANSVTARWNQLIKRMQEAVVQRPQLKPDLTRAANGIPDMIRAGKLELAMKLMDTVESVLRGEVVTPPSAASKPAAQDQQGAPYQGIVAYRKSLLEFDQAKKTVAAQIDALRKAIPSQMEGEQALADAISSELNALNDEIGDAIDKAMSASEDKASPVTDAVKMKLQKYLTEVQSNPLVKHVDKNPYGVKVAIESTLGSALHHVRSAMPV